MKNQDEASAFSATGEIEPREDLRTATGGVARPCEGAASRGRPGTRKPPTGPDLKSRALAAIAANWRDYGNSRPDLVREAAEFADVLGEAAGEKGRRKFYRWRDCVTKATPPDRTRPHEGREVATEGLRSARERARVAAERNLPAAPAPAYLLRAGAQGAKNIDFLAAVTEIWADAQRLRDLGMAADESAPDGKRIANPGIFDASIKRRLEVVESAIKVMREIWDLRYQQSFYDAIVSIIVDELASVPDIQECVCRKLAELNNNLGMTIYTESR